MQILCPPAVMSDEFSSGNSRKGVEGEKKKKTPALRPTSTQRHLMHNALQAE